MDVPPAQRVSIAFFKSLEDDISMGLKNNVTQKLMLIPFDKLKEFAFRELFLRIFNIAKSYEAVDMAKVIIDTWRDKSLNDTLAFETELFLWIHDPKDCAFARDAMIDETSLAFHLANIINHDESDENLWLAQRILDTYTIRNTDSATAETLLSQCKDKFNDTMATFVREQLIKPILSPASKPKWVFNLEPVLPSHDELITRADAIVAKHHPKKIQVLEVDDAVKLIIAGLSQQGLTPEETEETQQFLHGMYQSLTPGQKQAVLEQHQRTKETYSLSDDKNLFIWLGPTNMYIHADLTHDHRCCKYGGCRMLLCRCFVSDPTEGDFTPFDDNDELDWFTGACDICGQGIDHFWYAVRMPVNSGGWKNTYCSFSCLEKDIEDDLTHGLVSILRANIDGKGIQDRRLIE
jgi:hypothetical protein